MTTPTPSSGTRVERLRVPGLHHPPHAVHRLYPTSEAPLFRVAPHVPGSPIAPIRWSADRDQRGAMLGRRSQA
jgi:hypothetical protein